MKTKKLSPEKLQKRQLRKEKELKYWEKQKVRPKGNMYFWYLVLIIAMIYAVDEIASQISTLMQTEIANTFFQSESAVTLLNLLQIVAIPFQIVGILYRPLADRFGRKIFLIINTFGMSFALLIIFLSNNVFLYFQWRVAKIAMARITHRDEIRAARLVRRETRRARRKERKLTRLRSREERRQRKLLRNMK